MAADLAYFTQILGGRVVFAVQAMAARVAAIELTPGPPLLLLADHLLRGGAATSERRGLSTDPHRTSKAEGHRRPDRTNSETTAQGKLTPEKFVSHRFRLDSLMEAYDAFGRAAQTKALKVAITR